MKTIKLIDSHTAGEPTRLVIEGFPDLGTGDLESKYQLLKTNYDDWRKRVILEPRGNDILVGALLCPPANSDSVAGVIFFNNEGYLGMCGHGTIGVVTSLAYLGQISIGKHRIDTPVGTVTAELHIDGSVSIENVPSYRYRQGVTVSVPNYGEVSGDIAWGGNWFFLINQHDFELNIKHTKTLTDFTVAVKDALEVSQIFGENSGIIDHIELFTATTNADSKNFVLCPGGQYDRSPCGTGTSAKLACLAADKKLAESTIWRQASILDTVFEGSYRINDKSEIIPTIKGKAHICAETTLVLDETDPLLNGVVK